MIPIREEIIALRELAEEQAIEYLQCKGEFHPNFHEVADEIFYNFAFEAGRKAEREECAKVCESLPSLWPTEKVIADECAEAIKARRTE